MPQKEQFWKSIRFWTMVLGPIVSALYPYVLEQLPLVGQLTPAQYTALFAGGIVAVVGFIIARTLRNTAQSK